MSTTGGYHNGYFEAFDTAYIAVPGGLIAYDRETALAWYALHRDTNLYLDRGDGAEMIDVTSDFDDELESEGVAE